MKTFKSVLPKAAMIFIIFSVVCGIVYTGVVTGLAQLLFPDKANGSIIEVNGVKYGSELLAQQYSDEKYMWGRIMNVDVSTYTDKDGNRLMYAAPSNKSPASDAYEQMVAERVNKIRAANPKTCSGSGLDPGISPAAAEYQIPRLAEENKMTEEQVQTIIDKCSEGKFLGIFGEKTVNVLKVNLMLDGILK